MPKKILVIDDELDMLMMAVARLRQSGYIVLDAVNGQDGLNMARSEKPDVILLDLVMPIMDGYEACRILKSDDATKHIPVILFTASYGNARLDEKVLQLGADDYVAKPFDSRELLGKIRKALGEE